MKKETLGKFATLAMMFAALDSGPRREFVTESEMIQSRSFNTCYNLSPRMAKARKLRKQLKRQSR